MSEGTIESVEQLIDALDAAGADDAREAIYVAALALGELTARALAEPANGRPCDQWLTARASAGPPGVALPSWQEARKRALSGLSVASGADAYQLLMSGPSIAREWVIRMLQNAMLIAIERTGGGYLVVRVGNAWAVAMLAVGRGSETRQLYQGLKFHEMETKPTIFRLLEALQDEPKLLHHPALVRFAQRMWRQVAFPTTPDIPPPRPHVGVPPSVELLRTRLRVAGLDRLADAVTRAPAARTAADADFIERCWAAVSAGDLTVDVDDGVTDAIKEWLKEVVLGARTDVAVIAARSLYRAGRIDAAHAAVVLLRDLRAGDLPILLAGLRGEDGQPPQVFVDIAHVCARLDGAAADAALWLLMPSQIANKRARFNESVEHLDAIIEATRDAPAYLRELVEVIRAARAPSPPNLAIDGRVSRWFDAIRTHLSGLRSDQALDLPAFDVATARFARPLRDDDALRRRALPVVNEETSAIIRFVALGAFLHIEQDPEELQILRFQLAREIGQVNFPGLVPLRIRLLEEVLEGRRVRDIDLAEVLLLLGRSYGRRSRLADSVAMFEAAMREARVQRDDNLIAESICDWVGAQVSYARQQGIHGHDVDEWLELLGEARERSTSAIQQAFIEIAILGTLREGRHKKDIDAVRTAMLSSLKGLYRGMDNDNRVRISAGIANGLNEAYESEEAVAWIHEALDDLSIEEHPWAPARLFCELGRAYAHLDYYGPAMLSFERASAAAYEFGDDLQILQIEALGENYASRLAGRKRQRLEFVRRARHAAERLGDHQSVVQHGLREARCDADDWQAASALRAVGASLSLMRGNARFDDYSKQYQSLLTRFGFSDPPTPVPPPEYGPAETPSLPAERLEAMIATVELGGETDEVGKTLASFLHQACANHDSDIAILLAIRLLRACLIISDAELRDDLTYRAFTCLDALFAVWRFADSIVQTLSDATRALFALRVAEGPVLRGDEAISAIGWMGRFVGFQEQRNTMLAQQPEPVGAALWERWLLGHHLKDVALIIDALTEVQALTPDFLTGLPHLDPLADLLGSNATAIAMIPLDSARFAFFVAKAGDNGLRGAAWTAQPSPPPPVGDDPTGAQRTAINRWTAEVVRGMRRKVGFKGDVIWCAKGAAAMASPWEVFSDDVTRIRCAASPAVMPIARRATRPRSTLIVYADPGPSAPGDFGAPTLNWLGQLVGAASGAPTEVLAARGEIHGGQLPWFGGHVVQRAPSAEALLTRQRQHDLIVLVAHGRLDDADAEVSLVDDLGRTSRVTSAHIAASPGLLSGASVVLLSCHTGVAGQRLHRPAGFAGACLAAGAVEVLAPLRAVSIDVAIEIGSAVVQAYCEGCRLSEALADFMRSRRKGRGRDRDFATFVCWVG